jgi:two-component system nitrogen regulation sensor histidine kinase NtrY
MLFSWLNQYRRHFLWVSVLLLLCGGFFLSFLTYVSLTQGTLWEGTSKKLMWLLNLDLGVLIALGGVFAYRVVLIWGRRQNRSGAKIHRRLVALFSLLALVPAFLVMIFSAFIFNAGLQAWFSERVKTALDESSIVAEAYLAEHIKVIRASVETMARDLAIDFHGLSQNNEVFNRALDAHAEARNLSEALILTAHSEILARSRLSFSLEFELITEEDFRRSRHEVVIKTNPRGDRVRALYQLSPHMDAYILVGRIVDQNVMKRIDQVKKAVSTYHALDDHRQEIEVKFFLMFCVMTLLLLMGAIWAALWFANRLALPIGGLIDGAQEVSRGNLSIRVPLPSSQDELETLARAFNHMTETLSQQQRDLIDVNNQLDNRRQFMEDLLKGVTAGVMGISQKGEIRIMNPSAAAILDVDSHAVIGQDLLQVVPEMAPVIHEIKENNRDFSQFQIRLPRKGTLRIVLVRVVWEKAPLDGMIVTFDDITELASAQRKAAWADVARRIAHEIRNPLTPIQLSAERLRRKYLKEIQTDPAGFENCLETIVRQVSHLGRMVGEFSQFARMPLPIMAKEDLSKLCQQAIYMEQSAHTDVSFHWDGPEMLMMMCDGAQIGQVLTNLIQNAIDAVLCENTISDPTVWVNVKLYEESIELCVKDNGPGFPFEDRDRLTEPYVTNRSKGTGLGLAIVKKIIEEHEGTLILEDNLPAGACIRICFPIGLLKE